MSRALLESCSRHSRNSSAISESLCAVGDVVENEVLPQEGFIVCEVCIGCSSGPSSREAGADNERKGDVYARGTPFEIGESVLDSGASCGASGRRAWR